MQHPHRGRPRRTDIDRLALVHTLVLLQERGYDRLRMKDVAESAGIGLGALYRRWPGKKELVMAALRAEVTQRETEDTGDPRADLFAAVQRISEAMPAGLGRMLAVCLAEPDSELARVAIDAKLTPMLDGLTARLERVLGAAPDLRVRAECGLSFLLWRTALGGRTTDAPALQREVLHVMGVPSPAR